MLPEQVATYVCFSEFLRGYQILMQAANLQEFWGQVNNYIVRSYRDVIVVANKENL